MTSTPTVFLPPPSSLPSNFRTINPRASRVQGAHSNRQKSIALLDKYMPVLRGKCPAHFVSTRSLVLEDGHNCGLRPAVDHDYIAFKSNFRFAPFTYCYYCCLPQEQRFNGLQTVCHAGYIYTRNTPCPFAGFIFKAVFYLWKTSQLKDIYIEDGTLQQFCNWASQESPDKATYNNCLEAFLFFCRKVEKDDPKFFSTLI